MGFGQGVVNAWLRSRPLFAEVIAPRGFDPLTVDMQHGVHGIPARCAVLPGYERHPVTPIGPAFPGTSRQHRQGARRRRPMACRPMLNTRRRPRISSSIPNIAEGHALDWPYPLAVRLAAPIPQPATDEIVLLPPDGTQDRGPENMEGDPRSRRHHTASISARRPRFSTAWSPKLDRDEPEIPQDDEKIRLAASLFIRKIDIAFVAALAIRSRTQSEAIFRRATAERTWERFSRRNDRRLV